MDLFAKRGFVIADGKRMAISLPQFAHDKKDRNLWLLSDYYATGISFYQPTAGFVGYGGEFAEMVSRQPEVTVEIKARSVQSVPFEEGIKPFRNADSLSVNELLAIAYQKMESRQS
jgi:hypothetical protein